MTLFPFCSRKRALKHQIITFISKVWHKDPERSMFSSSLWPIKYKGFLFDGIRGLIKSKSWLFERRYHSFVGWISDPLWISLCPVFAYQRKEPSIHFFCFAPMITATAVTLKVDVFSIKILVRRCRNVIMASNCNFWVTDWTGADPDLEPANKVPI